MQKQMNKDTEQEELDHVTQPTKLLRVWDYLNTPISELVQRPKFRVETGPEEESALESATIGLITSPQTNKTTTR